MELKRELHLGIGALGLFIILLSFGAIGLFNRMTPAIERILRENVYSIEATEEILALVAMGEQIPEPQRRARYEDALERVRMNVTEEEERAPIQQIQQLGPRALSGDRAAVVRIVQVLQQLVRINRNAMRRVDDEAKRLGTGGAWAAVFLALAGFLVSTVVIRRASQRILEPFRELYSTLEAVSSGNTLRRCRPIPAPLEISRVLKAVNTLLDEHMSMSGAGVEEAAEEERSTTHFLLDHYSRPALILDREGSVLMASRSALEVLGSSQGKAIRKAVENAVVQGGGVSGEGRGARGEGREESSAELSTQRIPSTELWFCTIGKGAGLLK